MLSEAHPIGNRTWKHVSPGLDSKRTLPRCLRTIRATVSRPRPVPSDLLGGEERFEDARANGRRYASSVVTNLNHDVGWLALGAYLQLSTFAHRIDCVDNQIGPNLVELATVRLDQR